MSTRPNDHSYYRLLDMAKEDMNTVFQRLGEGYPPGIIIMKKPKVKEQPDGTFKVTFRFRVKPERSRKRDGHS